MKNRIIAILLFAMMILMIVPLTNVAADGDLFAITDGTAQNAHGSISFDKTFAEAQELVTVTVTPDEGYVLKSIHCAITAISGSDVPASKVNDTTFTFIMPTYDVTVTAVFYDPTSPVVNEYGIIENPPAGKTVSYKRAAGNAAFNYVPGIGTRLENQSGNVTMVECENGDVYWQNPLSTIATGAWIKGEKVGNTISFDTFQPIALGNSGGQTVTLSVRWGYLQYPYIYSCDVYSDKIVFEVVGDTLIMQGTSAPMLLPTSPDYFIGLFWDNGTNFSGYGDLGVTLISKPAPEIVRPPVGLVTTEFTRMASGTNGPLKDVVLVGWDDSDVYMKNLCPDFPDAWVKGTLGDGGIVTFEKNQYIGELDGYDIFLTGVDLTDDNIDTYSVDNTKTFGDISSGETVDTLDTLVGASNQLADFTMLYDAEHNDFTSIGLMFENASDERIYYLDYFQQIVLFEKEVCVVSLGAKVNESTSSLRLGAQYNGYFLTPEEIESVEDLGMIFYPSHLLGDNELVINTPGAARLSAVAIDEEYFDPDKTFADYETFVFYVTIVNIPDKGKDTDIAFRPYIIYSEGTVYGETLERNYNDTLKASHKIASEQGDNEISCPSNWFD